MRKIYFTTVLILIIVDNQSLAQTKIFKTTSPLVMAVAAAGPIVDPLPLTYNSLQFDYDLHGNQIRRKLIYLAARSSSNNNAPQQVNDLAKKFEESDLYKDVSYYPNPVQEMLSVKWRNEFGNSVISLQLINISGQMVQEFDNMKDVQNIEVNFQEYPSGLYELVLVYSNGDQKTLKIVKR